MRMSGRFILLIFCVALLSQGAISSAFADPIEVACDEDTIRTAVQTAAEGSTIKIRPGECTITNGITISRKMTILGAGVIAPTEDNALKTRILCHASYNNNRSACFRIAAKTRGVRISGIVFDADIKNYHNNFAIMIGETNYRGQAAWDFRIDHNMFVDFRQARYYGNGNYVIRSYGFNFGLIDNNWFRDCRGEVMYLAGDGSDAFERRPFVGGYPNGTIFIEDNRFELTGVEPFSGANAVDMAEGVRVVFRHNTMVDAPGSCWGQPVEAHGFCVCDGMCGTGGDIRGTLSYEVYENDINSVSADTSVPCNVDTMFRFRGGGGMVFGNRLRGRHRGVYLDNERSYNYGSCRTDTQASPLYELQCHVDSDDGKVLINEGFSSSSGLSFGTCRDQINELYFWNNDFNGRPLVATDVTINDVGYVKDDITIGDSKKSVHFVDASPDGYIPYPYPHPLQRGIESDSVPQPPTGLRLK